MSVKFALLGLLAVTMEPCAGLAGSLEFVEFCGQRLSRDESYVTCNSRQVSDLSPLKKFPRLQYLDLTGTSVRDLTPLARIPKLWWLIIDSGLDPSPLAGQAELEIEFRPVHKGRIAGKIWDDQKNKTLARVSLDIRRTDSDCSTRLTSRRTGPDGAFVFDGLAFGNYLLSLYAHSSIRLDPAGDDGNDGWEIRAEKECRVGALLWKRDFLRLIDAKKVTGLVRDAKGAALPGARVEVSFRAKPKCAPRIPYGEGRDVGSAWLGRIGTGPDGRFVFQTQVLTGHDLGWDVFEMKVSVWTPGYERLKLVQKVEGPLGAGLDLGELRLKPAS